MKVSSWRWCLSHEPGGGKKAAEQGEWGERVQERGPPCVGRGARAVAWRRVELGGGGRKEDAPADGPFSPFGISSVLQVERRRASLPSGGGKEAVPVVAVGT